MYQDEEDAGYMLVAVIVLVFLVLLALTIAAPKVAMQLQREREMEAQHRANQYVRAIRVYYRKFQHYPGSIEQLDKTNNQKFLRQHYLDPFTGKDDWKLIQVGQNKTTVKGFFGEDLPGMAGGLGAAAGMQSGGTGATSGGSSSTTPTFGSGSTNVGTSLGSGSGTAPGSGSGTGAASGTGLGSGTGIGEQNATDYKGGGGPFMGVGVSMSGDAMLTVNEQTHYQDWEFLYDPRIEQLYAKGNLLGGGGQMSGSSGTGTAPTGAFPPLNGTSGTTGNTGTPTPPTSPMPPTPQ